MSIDKAIADLQAALEENTKAMKELTARIVGVAATSPTATVKIATASTVHTTGVAVPSEHPAAVSVDTAAITYKELSECFLGLIKLLGTAAAAKKAVLEPLQLVDLKSNQDKPEIFPAIMEKIKAAEAAHKAAV